MGVYIKGIDVPKEGTVVVIDSTGQVWSNEWPTRGYTRIDGAKAVPVPEHGRLIDADALGIRDEEKRAYEAYQMEKHEFFTEEPLLEYKRGLSEGLIRASGIVRFAPTIIPADKEERHETALY